MPKKPTLTEAALQALGPKTLAALELEAGAAHGSRRGQGSCECEIDSTDLTAPAGPAHMRIIEQMIARLQGFVNAGVNVIVLLALSDQGRPSYDAQNATAIAGMGCPVFACTQDQFRDLMAMALKRADLWAWAAGNDIALVRPR